EDRHTGLQLFRVEQRNAAQDDTLFLQPSDASPTGILREVHARGNLRDRQIGVGLQLSQNRHVNFIDHKPILWYFSSYTTRYHTSFGMIYRHGWHILRLRRDFIMMAIAPARPSEQSASQALG